MTVQDGDVLEVAFNHDNTLSGDQSNIYQFKVQTLGPVSDEDILDDLEGLFENLYNIIKTMINIRNVFRDITVRNVTQDKLVGSTIAGAYTGGTAPDPAVPQGVAPLIYFKTDVPRVILRKFLPSPSESNMAAGGSIGATYTALMNNFAQYLLGSMIGLHGSYDYGYLSEKTLAFEYPNIYVVRGTPAYQRRRKPGVGS